MLGDVCRNGARGANSMVQKIRGGIAPAAPLFVHSLVQALKAPGSQVLRP